MSKHNPKEFDGCCPKCGSARIEFLENTKNESGEKITKFYCFKCQIVIVINDNDEVEEFYDN